MNNKYMDVTTRFLRDEERFVLSEEKEMPLVIEANKNDNLNFLKDFLTCNSEALLSDIAKYGAILLRGFAVNSEKDFEDTVLSIQGMRGISDAFMSEEGRDHVDDLKYVLHTNSVYKTGGTLYLGGFHSENYYSPDVPTYISFYCLKPSQLGGETGLINMEKIYKHLDPQLRAKLENNAYYVTKWLVSEVMERYKISAEKVKDICQRYDLPIIGKDKDQFILMYKPNVFEHPVTKQKALGINLFEIATLNKALRNNFMNDYSGKTWFWHRFFWKSPVAVLKVVETAYMACASFFHSPKDAMHILKNKLLTYKTEKNKTIISDFNDKKVGSCFTEHDVNNLAKLMRDNYSSCLWRAGDIIIVDNRKVMHAGMPGSGPRTVRAMICNPLEIKYSATMAGVIPCEPRLAQTIGEQSSL